MFSSEQHVEEPDLLCYLKVLLLPLVMISTNYKILYLGTTQCALMIELDMERVG